MVFWVGIVMVMTTNEVETSQTFMPFVTCSMATYALREATEATSAFDCHTLEEKPAVACDTMVGGNQK